MWGFQLQMMRVKTAVKMTVIQEVEVNGQTRLKMTSTPYLTFRPQVKDTLKRLHSRGYLILLLVDESCDKGQKHSEVGRLANKLDMLHQMLETPFAAIITTSSFCEESTFNIYKRPHTGV